MTNAARRYDSPLHMYSEADRAAIHPDTYDKQIIAARAGGFRDFAEYRKNVTRATAGLEHAGSYPSPRRGYVSHNELVEFPCLP